MREIILVFEGGFDRDEKEISDVIQSNIFRMMRENDMNVRHFSDERIDHGRMAAIRMPSQELMIPKFMTAAKNRKHR